LNLARFHTHPFVFTRKATAHSPMDLLLEVLHVVSDFLSPKDLLVLICSSAELKTTLSDDVALWGSVLRRAAQRRALNGLLRRKRVCLPSIILPCIRAQVSTCVRCWKLNVPRGMRHGKAISVCNPCADDRDAQLALWDRARIGDEIRASGMPIKVNRVMTWFRTGRLVYARRRSGGATLYWASEVRALIYSK